mgnify:FL=1
MQRKRHKSQELVTKIRYADTELGKESTVASMLDP